MAGSESLTERDVRRIVGLIESLDRSSFDSMELDLGGLKLTLGRGEALGAADAASAQPAAPRPAAVMPAHGPTLARLDPPLPAAASDIPAGTIAVVSPLTGTFYGRSDPMSPPFVTVGARVTADMTVGLVEIMKVFNAIAAGHDGVVVSLCAGDGDGVTAGQPLLYVSPGAGAGA